MKNIAIVTYNRISKDIHYADGWHGQDGRRALVLQNTDGSTWGSRPKGSETPAGENRISDEYAGRVETQIDALWNELSKKADELDQIVVYLGSRGCERAVGLAATLPAHKVTFVACDCGLEIKEAAIQTANLSDARRILCECGGHKTLERLFLGFLNTGVLVTPRWITLEE